MKFRKGQQIRIFKDTDTEAYARWIHDEGYNYKVGSEYITILGLRKRTIDPLKLARTLRIARKKKGIRREDLCEAIGVKYETLFWWEIGRSKPRADNLEKYCGYVGLNVKDVIKECQIEEE